MSGARRARKSLLALGAALALVAPVLAWPTAAVAEPVGSLSKFSPVQPGRILDTREGLGAPRGVVPAGGSLRLAVLGRGGVPSSGVSTVVLNVTITGTTGTGHVSVYPGGGTDNGSSAFNHTPQTPTIAGLVHAPVGADGTVTIYTARGGHLLADVFGYYSASGQSSDGRFLALSPSRILDTRTTSEPAPAPAPAPTSPSPSPSPRPTSTTPANPGDTKNCGDFSTWSEAQDWFEYYYPHYGDVANLDADSDLVACESLPGAPSNLRTGGNIKASAGSSTVLQVTGRGGVPASGVSAVALNITATQAERAGFVQVIPTGGSTQTGTSSNLNISRAGQTIANLIIVPVGSNGQVTLYASQATHLLADVAGYYTDNSAETSTAGLFQAVEPMRELDTRAGFSRGKILAGGQAQIDMTVARSIPSSGVAAVVLNVAAVQPEATGFVQVFPTGQATTGSSSNINFTSGQVIANSALVPLGSQGNVSLYVSQNTHLIADAYGYFVTDSTTPETDATLSGLRIAPHNTTVAYNRDEWVHWIDDDSDCQNTRAEVLWIESEITGQYDTAGCVVVSGQWTDPYTGKIWTAASELDVDHTVALQNAHLSGGHAWDAARKQAYANDWMQPEHLNAIEDNLNASKGASAPDAWKPPLQSAWCFYAIDWAEIKKRWDLTVTQFEYDALEDMLATC